MVENMQKSKDCQSHPARSTETKSRSYFWILFQGFVNKGLNDFSKANSLLESIAIIFKSNFDLNLTWINFSVWPRVIWQEFLWQAPSIIKWTFKNSLGTVAKSNRTSSPDEYILTFVTHYAFKLSFKWSFTVSSVVDSCHQFSYPCQQRDKNLSFEWVQAGKRLYQKV